MSSPPTIKTLTITGGAAEDFQKGGKGGTRRKESRKNNTSNQKTVVSLENADSSASASPSTNVVSTITYTPSNKTNLMHGGAATVVKNNVPPEPSTVARPVAAAAPIPTVSVTGHHGGVTTKLVLAPPKRRETRLLMKGPKTSTGGIVTTQTQPQTRKKVRKITLGLRGLTAKIHKAQKLHKRVEDMKKDEVKKLLVEKGIIKNKNGKKDPPEALMRQMYSDYLLLTTKGL